MDSQDAWVFTAPLLGTLLPKQALVQMNFSVGGVMRCDNRIAKIMESFGMDLHNPSYLIRTIHLQRGQGRGYFEETHVAGGTLFVGLDLTYS